MPLRGRAGVPLRLDFLGCRQLRAEARARSFEQLIGGEELGAVCGGKFAQLTVLLIRATLL